MYALECAGNHNYVSIDSGARSLFEASRYPQTKILAAPLFIGQKVEDSQALTKEKHSFFSLVYLFHQLRFIYKIYLYGPTYVILFIAS